jgi:KDO2-lipid IV(A) lauroyltransferase
VSVKDRAADLAYAAGWAVVKGMPASLAAATFRAGADRAARKHGPGTQRLAGNLRRVVGPDLPEAEFEELVRDGLRSYARYWLEAFRLPRYSRQDLLDGFVMDDEHKLADAVASGSGCVCALSHSGNWDFAGAWVGAHGWPLTTVAERLKPERLYERFLAYRESLGMEIIPASGGSRPPLDVLTERLTGRAPGDGVIVPLLADRDLSRRGIEVEFFGARTRMPAGPALLALRTGAPIYAVPIWYEGPLARGRVDGPLPLPADGPLDVRVRALTQTMADHLAVGVADHPADWHMLQKLWLDHTSQPVPVLEAEST